MKCGHLFNGIGGFALAAHWMGWENVFHCEIDNFCNQVMKKHFPKSRMYGDIRKQAFGQYRDGDNSVGLISGGDPCQPSSVNGSRKGKADPRYLWPQYLRCVVECRPKWIVNENVTGTISNGILDQKIYDLEANGYTCWTPLVIPASAVGALHRRDRVWLVAYADEQRQKKCNTAGIGNESEERRGFLYPRLSETEWGKGKNKSSILRMANGVPGQLDRAKRIGALGNAIVPQVALKIFEAIEYFEKQNK
jgi:DNA (cytosine-5)-methyltransferase 1